MLEQERADWLLDTRKIYSHGATIELSPGTDADYQVEDADGNEFFLLDVRRPRLNQRSVRLQLRYRPSLVLARLCTAVVHTSPDGAELQAPHFLIGIVRVTKPSEPTSWSRLMTSSAP